AAILRRMPKRFYIRPPNPEQRRKILQIMLKDAVLEDGFDFDALVRITDGMASSDLKELCRDAAMIPIREYLRSHPITAPADSDSVPPAEAGAAPDQQQQRDSIRPLRLSDFVKCTSDRLQESIYSSLSYNQNILSNVITPPEHVEGD
ncbi:mitochondrial dynamin GTPase Msp1, partial [Spiromyces aspiralis]